MYSCLHIAAKASHLISVFHRSVCCLLVLAFLHRVAALLVPLTAGHEANDLDLKTEEGVECTHQVWHFDARHFSGIPLLCVAYSRFAIPPEICFWSFVMTRLRRVKVGPVIEGGCYLLSGM